MKMKDILNFNNCLFVYDQINQDMPSNFEDFFTTSNSTIYGLNSVRHRAAFEWNEITKTINTIDQNNLISRTKFIKTLKELILSSYDLNRSLFTKCKVMTYKIYFHQIYFS